MTAPSPYVHRCLLAQCDYTDVDTGLIVCRIDRGGCGREWTFVPGRGWVPDPVPVGTFRKREHHG